MLLLNISPDKPVSFSFTLPDAPVLLVSNDISHPQKHKNTHTTRQKKQLTGSWWWWFRIRCWRFPLTDMLFWFITRKIFSSRSFHYHTFNFFFCELKIWVKSTFSQQRLYRNINTSHTPHFSITYLAGKEKMHMKIQERYVHYLSVGLVELLWQLLLDPCPHFSGNAERRHVIIHTITNPNNIITSAQLNFNISTSMKMEE